MKKFKLIFSTFCLAIALTFTAGAFTNVYAGDTDPQEVIRSGQSSTPPSTPTPTPPPPQQPPSPTTVVAIIAILLGLI